MTSRVIKTGAERDNFIALLQSYKLPCTVSLVEGQKRSVEQNNTQWLWLNEAAKQLGEYTAEGYRAYCKLHFGVPIMRAENEKFREVYDRLIRPRSYEEKLELMAIPMDLPVTRIMTTNQKARYLDAVYQHFSDLDVKLTEPEQQ